MNNKQIFFIFVRYLLLLLLALPNLFLIYAIFTPITLYPSYWAINALYGATLSGTFIQFDGNSIELVSACIAGAAYYLLIVLNLTTPMQSSQRWKSIFFLLLTFLILNILRIVIFTILLQNHFTYFDFAHKLVWYAGSTVFVVVLWFVNVLLFRIKNVPVYTDAHLIFKEILRIKPKKNRL